MRSPLVSVVIPTFNAEATIGSCIRSVLAQDIEDFEIIVIDDCSTDSTLAEVRRFSDPRLKVCALEQNCGVSFARNEGIRRAEGKWLGFLDADDEFHSDHLESMIRICETNNVLFSAPTRVAAVPGSDARLKSIDTNSIDVGAEEIIFLSRENFIQYINSVFIVVDIEFVRHNEIYFPEGEDGGDWTDFMFGIIQAGASGCLLIGKQTYLYRVTGSHFSSSFKSIEDQARSLYRLSLDPKIPPEVRRDIRLSSRNVEKRLVVAALREKKYGYFFGEIVRDPLCAFSILKSVVIYVFRRSKYYVASKLK